ncbi:MAG: SGNH/GDSL hydrolase family protein, partial [Clostridia bacterium]|nr:SGNH/GDSL hydrolase family protein [Clostridia bacterium]
GEQFLPQMGLDTEKYEMVMDENTYRNFRSSYQPYVFQGKLAVGEYKSVLTKIVIRNKETGETTKGATHLCKLYYVEKTVDPATYDLDLPADVHAEMMEKSFVTMGNVSRLASVFARAEKGEKITSAYIGGSLTQAGTPDKNGNWASGTSAWLERKFPKAEIVHVNAGWGGTGSAFGAVRFASHVLAYDPDIVFIEFSVNDSSDSDYHKQSMESLVRRALEFGDDTAVVIVLSSMDSKSDSYMKCRQMHKDLAAYYGLPVIDFYSGLHVGINKGLFDYGIISVDGIHLNTWGYQAELDMVEYMLDNICEKISTSSASELKIPAIPEKLFAPGDRFMDLVTINPNMNANLITSLGSWKKWETAEEGEQYRVGYTCSGLDGNDPFKFTFTGSDLYIQMYGTDTVNLKVVLDDGAGHRYEYLYGADADKPYRVNGDPLVKSTYDVTITVDNPTAGVDVVFFDITYR